MQRHSYSRLAAPSGAGAPAAGRGLGSAPQARGALPCRGSLDPRAAAARCRAPSPARLGPPPPRWSAPARPPPPALRLLCTRDARSGRRGAPPPQPRARARARRAQGARARPPRAPPGLACCCPGKHVHCGGRGWGPLCEGGTRGAELLPRGLHVVCAPPPQSLLPARLKIPKPQREKASSETTAEASLLPLQTPESCHCTGDGRGRRRKSGDPRPLLSG